MCREAPVSLPLRYNWTQFSSLCCVFMVHFPIIKWRLQLSTRWKKIVQVIFFLLLLFLFFCMYMSLCSTCVHEWVWVGVCVCVEDRLTSSVFSLSLLFFEQCILLSPEFTMGVGSRPQVLMLERQALYPLSHLPSVLLGRFNWQQVGYLGSAFVSVLKIPSRFEVQVNDRILELG